MPSVSVKIEENIEKSFDSVLNKFKEDMNIKGAITQEPIEVKVKTRGVMGEMVEVNQTISVDKEYYQIKIENETKKTKAITTFSFEAKGDKTILVYSEFPSGATSKVRSLNYLMFELPLLSRGTKKKMNNKLAYIKNFVEGIN